VAWKRKTISFRRFKLLKKYSRSLDSLKAKDRPRKSGLKREQFKNANLDELENNDRGILMHNTELKSLSKKDEGCETKKRSGGNPIKEFILKFSLQFIYFTLMISILK